MVLGAKTSVFLSNTVVFGINTVVFDANTVFIGQLSVLAHKRSAVNVIDQCQLLMEKVKDCCTYFCVARY